MFDRHNLALQNLFLFFFNDTATTEIYTLSLHDALPISHDELRLRVLRPGHGRHPVVQRDRKSTRLNSSHLVISYAVFCLKKKSAPSSPPHALYARTQE